MSMQVTIEQSASIMLTASRRPPSPTSSTTASGACTLKESQDRQRGELEVRERRIAARPLDRFELHHELRIGDGRAD
jgi:hypothetical protein